MGKMEFIRFKVDMVVKLIDSFTGNTMTESGIRFFINREPFKPEIKEGGYYVFCNIGKDEIDFTVECPAFQKITRKVIIEELNKKITPIITISMMPSPEYVLPSDAMKVRLLFENSQGKGIPDVETFFVPWRNKSRIKFGGYIKKNTVKFFDPLKQIMVGETYAMLESQTNKIKLFSVQKRIGEDEFEITGGLKSNLQSLVITPVLKEYSNGFGEVYFPLSNDTSVEKYYLLYTKNGRMIKKEIPFLSGGIHKEIINL